jgi:hypothetical protein
MKIKNIFRGDSNTFDVIETDAKKFPFFHRQKGGFWRRFTNKWETVLLTEELEEKYSTYKNEEA